MQRRMYLLIRAARGPRQTTRPIRSHSGSKRNAPPDDRRHPADQSCLFPGTIGACRDGLFEQEVAPHVYDGYTANYTPVKVSSAKDLRGKILPVLLRETDGNNCYGTVQENI